VPGSIYSIHIWKTGFGAVMSNGILLKYGRLAGHTVDTAGLIRRHKKKLTSVGTYCTFWSNSRGEPGSGDSSVADIRWGL
jgi:hypothetical protein